MKTTPWRFALKFLLGLALLTAAFESSRGTAFERFIIEDLVLAPSVRMINAISPGDSVALAGRTMVSGASRLHVTRGCEGVEMFLLLIAAQLAFPASREHRVRGMIVGFVLAYVLCVARLTALDYALLHAPNTWQALHGLILPLAPVIAIAIYFLHWSAAAAPARRADQHHAA